MSKTPALLRRSLILLLFVSAIGAFAAEEPLSDVPELPLNTMESMPVAAASGEEMLVAWKDQRLSGIFAARFGRDGKRIDAPPIRIASDPRISYDPTSIANNVIAFQRTAYENNTARGIGLVRIANNKPGTPRVVAEGWSPRLFSNGHTFLLTYSDQGMHSRAMVLSRELAPVATIDIGDQNWISAVAPVRGGYIAIRNKTETADAIRIGDDGKSGEPIPIGTANSAAVASDGERAVVLTSHRATLRTTIIDSGHVSRATDVARCGEFAVVKSITRTADGYLALAQCASEFQLVTIPPLPRNKLATFRFDRNGSLLDIKPVESDVTHDTGDVVDAGGKLLAIANYDHRNANVARLTHGRLTLGPFVAVGAPDLFEITLQRDGDTDIVRWSDFRRDQPRVFETRITRTGVDPQYRGVPTRNFDFPERTRLPNEAQSKIYLLLEPFRQVHRNNVVMGSGEDGYMVVLNESPMRAFHIDPTLTHITQLPDLGEGKAEFAIRRNGYGVVIFSRAEDAAPFFGVPRYYAVVTK